jgi:PCFT/HCP family folate transporter-like MFS transporter 1/3
MFTGTVFALTSVIESLTPIAASPLYTFVYNATLLTVPGTFYILSCAIFSLDIILLRFVAPYRNISIFNLTADRPIVYR